MVFHALLTTGWLAKLQEYTPLYLNRQSGLGVDETRYLLAKDVALIGIDARTIEKNPSTYKEIAPVHQELITKNGVLIIENLDTRGWYKDKVDEFLFVLGIPKFRETVQGIINPIAIR